MKDLVLSDRELEKCKENIVNAIENFVDETGVQGAVFGLSGGVDSAVVGTLAKLALGDRLRALIMPESGVTQKDDIEHALELSKNQKIPYSKIGLNEALTAVKKTFPEIMEESTEGGFHARANLAPRLRMLFNYAIANLDDLVVLGTGNKTELLLGYFTKYGDGGVDYLPIGDLYKTQVLQLARHLGLPGDIIDKPPSAGLWHGQTDEEELGESYENIDRILVLLYEKGRSVAETASIIKIEQRQVERINAISKRNSHKLVMPKILKLF
jgi:NAD+ synthase